MWCSILLNSNFSAASTRIICYKAKISFLDWLCHCWGQQSPFVPQFGSRDVWKRVRRQKLYSLLNGVEMADHTFEGVSYIGRCVKHLNRVEMVDYTFKPFMGFQIHDSLIYVYIYILRIHIKPVSILKILGSYWPQKQMKCFAGSNFATKLQFQILHFCHCITIQSCTFATAGCTAPPNLLWLVVPMPNASGKSPCKQVYPVWDILFIKCWVKMCAILSMTNRLMGYL